MSNLSKRSQTLLEMADEIYSPTHSKNTEDIQKQDDFSEKRQVPTSPRLSDQMKIFLEDRNGIPSDVKKELINNQKKIDSFLDQKQNKSPKSKCRNLTVCTKPRKTYQETQTNKKSPKIETFSPKKESKKNSNSQTEIDTLDNSEMLLKDERIMELEAQLKQERETRQLLTQALESSVTKICNNSLTVKQSTVKTISQLMQKINVDNVKVSTARLLKQSIDEMLKEIPEEETIPSKMIQQLSPKKNSESPWNDTLARGCEELASSLSEGFYEGEVQDFGELSSNPVEFARYVNQIKRAHDIGIAELRGHIEFLEERTKKVEELEEKGTISDETAKLVDNLTKMMDEFSLQSRREYEDLIENIE